MNHAMNCNEAQRALDSAFDEGIAVPAHVAAHTATCRACAAYGDSLATLDLNLRLAPPIQPAPALVARIQADIATQPRRVLRPWVYPVGVAAAVLFLAALGPFVNGLSWLPVMETATWLPREPVLPEWEFVKQELTGIPASVAGDVVTLGRRSEGAWASANGWLSLFGRGYSPWMWIVFGVCVAAACALDGMEWMSRRVHRS